MAVTEDFIVFERHTVFGQVWYQPIMYLKNCRNIFEAQDWMDESLSDRRGKFRVKKAIKRGA